MALKKVSQNLMFISTSSRIGMAEVSVVGKMGLLAEPFINPGFGAKLRLSFLTVHY